MEETSAVMRDEIRADRARKGMNRLAVAALVLGIAILTAFGVAMYRQTQAIERTQASVERALLVQADADRERYVAERARADALSRFAQSTLHLIERHDLSVRQDLDRALALINAEVNFPPNRERPPPTRVTPGTPGFIGPVAPRTPPPSQCQPSGKSGKCKK